MQEVATCPAIPPAERPACISAFTIAFLIVLVDICRASAIPLAYDTLVILPSNCTSCMQEFCAIPTIPAAWYAVPALVEVTVPWKFTFEIIVEPAII